MTIIKEETRRVIVEESLKGRLLALGAAALMGLVAKTGYDIGKDIGKGVSKIEAVSKNKEKYAKIILSKMENGEIENALEKLEKSDKE